MSKKVYIVIGCDTDPDRASVLNGVADDRLSWRGMTEGIPRLRDRLSRFRDSSGSTPVYTWCLRADYQIKHLEGAYNHILEKHKNFLLDLESEGDELSWHPHFWRFDECGQMWYQDHEDIDWQVRLLQESYSAFQSSLPNRAKSVRMGWVYHNNRTFAALDALGILVDFSGIPGLRIMPTGSARRLANFFDWSQAPNHPYYPSRNNYQREARDGEESFALLEAPNFVTRSVFWGLVGGLQLARKMKSARVLWASLQRPSYWISITAKPILFVPLLSHMERSLRRRTSVFFVNYFHPDELLPNKSGLYSLENMDDNIRALLDICDKLKAESRFITASQIRDLYKQTQPT